MLQSLEGQGYVKAGFLGFHGSGKSYTATLLAIGVREFFGLEGPIAMFDTEGGGAFLAPSVRERTGCALIGVRSRSLDDLLLLGEECLAAEVAVLIVDSITHVYREVCDSYLAEINRMRHGKDLAPRRRLERNDWGAIKATFARWTEFHLNSRLHIITAGRAGYEYDFEEDPETGADELRKLPLLKWKTEAEFAFEPNLLVEMEVRKVAGGSGIRRVATVLKDRADQIDGMVVENPTFEDFRPHLEMLRPGAAAAVDTTLKTVHGIGESGDGDWHREKRQRTILAEEIQGALLSRYPSMSAAHKKARAALLFHVLETRSWTRVENAPSQKLAQGLEDLKETLGNPEYLEAVLERADPPTPPTDEATPD